MITYAASPRRGPQRAHGPRRLGVHAHLEPAGGPEDGPALPQHVRGAQGAHRVHHVVGELGLRPARARVSQANDADGIVVARPRSRRRASATCPSPRTAAAAARWSSSVGEHDALQEPSERRPVVEHGRRDRRLAVGDRQAEHLADDDLERHRERRPSGDLVEARRGPVPARAGGRPAGRLRDRTPRAPRTGRGPVARPASCRPCRCRGGTRSRRRAPRRTAVARAGAPGAARRRSCRAVGRARRRRRGRGRRRGPRTSPGGSPGRRGTQGRRAATSSVAWASIGRQNRSSSQVRTGRDRISSSTAHPLVSSIDAQYPAVQCRATRTVARARGRRRTAPRSRDLRTAARGQGQVRGRHHAGEDGRTVTTSEVACIPSSSVSSSHRTSSASSSRPPGSRASGGPASSSSSAGAGRGADPAHDRRQRPRGAARSRS